MADPVTGIGWWLPVIAFAAMFAEDLVAVILVQAEADGIVAGHMWLTVATVAARLAADYCGTYTGVRVGARIRNRIEGQ